MSYALKTLTLDYLNLLNLDDLNNLRLEAIEIVVDSNFVSNFNLDTDYLIYHTLSFTCGFSCDFNLLSNVIVEHLLDIEQLDNYNFELYLGIESNFDFIVQQNLVKEFELTPQNIMELYYEFD